MQGKPAFARLNIVLQSHLLFFGRNQIAGVGDQKVAFTDRLEIMIVRRHLGADILMFREELEQFKARKIDVVIVPRRDQIDVDHLVISHFISCARAGNQNCMRLVSPPSMTMLAPVVKEPRGLASSVT